MAETSAQDTEKQIMLQRIYVKDCSFESPRAPEIFSQTLSPAINVNMETGTKPLADGNVEVVLSVTAKATHEDRAVFLVEVHQAGVFTIKGFSEQELNMILATYCPTILFPYLREAVSDLTLKGGMAPLLLQPVNFDAVYAQKLAEQTRSADESQRN